MYVTEEQHAWKTSNSETREEAQGGWTQSRRTPYVPYADSLRHTTVGERLRVATCRYYPVGRTTVGTTQQYVLQVALLPVPTSSAGTACTRA